jgi:hypothetical protein
MAATKLAIKERLYVLYEKYLKMNPTVFESSNRALQKN